jgi:hypothetical protein
MARPAGQALVAASTLISASIIAGRTHAGPVTQA